MKFLVCYDNSGLSQDVVREAQKHARVWNAELRIVKAVKREDPIRHARLLEMEEQLESEIQQLFVGLDIPYNVQLLIDDIDIGKKIVDLADAKRVDLIFLGIKKHSKVGKLLFGSTAQHIILHSYCPVVTMNQNP